MGQHVLVVIPAYNAAKTLEGVFERFTPELRDRLAGFLVVDDGSTDNTLEVLQRIKEKDPKVNILRHYQNRGYGGAEKTLLHNALGQGADIVVLVHADGQYAPECLPELLAPIESGEADVVQGSRMLEGGALRGGMPLYKYISNKVLTFIENRAFGLKMAEYHSGYMVYSSRFLRATRFLDLSDSFDFDLEMILAARILGFRLKEVAIPTRYADEVSHLNPIRYGLDVLRIVFRYRRGYYHRLFEEDPGRA